MKLLWPSLLIFLATGPILLDRSYRTLTEPGWERNVPGWWLIYVELPYASGARFDQACAGVLRNSALSQSEVQTAGSRVFEQLRGQPPSQMRAQSSAVLMLAGTVGQNPLCDVEEICRVTQACMQIPPHDDHGRWQLEQPIVKFVPQGWEVKYSVELKDPDNNSVITSGSGHAGHGSGGGFSTHGVVNRTGTYTAVWSFKLGRVGEEPLRVWEERTPFVFDQEKADEVKRDPMKALKEQSEAFHKKMMDQMQRFSGQPSNR